MSTRKSETKLERSISDIERGIPKDSKENPSLSKTSDYRVIRESTTKTRKSPSKPHNPAVIESTRKAEEYTRKAFAADKIQKHWRNYRRRHPKEPDFQKLLRTSFHAVSRTLSKLLIIKGGKRTRRQKR